MANFNKVFLMGNLTRDVELKSIAGGQSVARIGMAINRSYTLQSGEKREEVTYVDCEAWGKQAEVMAKYLAKGRPVFIEGRLKLDMWEDKEGKKQSKMKVVVDAFQFIDSKGGGGGGGGGAGGGSSAASDYAGDEAPATTTTGWAPKPSPAAGRRPAEAAPAEDDIPF
jgi:single-strand DNA-binding protein